MIVTKCSRARSGGGGGLLAQFIARRGMASRQVAPHSPPPTRAVLDTITSMARPAPHTSASLLFRSTTTTDAATAMMMMATAANPSSFLLRATTSSAGASAATGEGVKNNKSSTAAVGAQLTTAATITSGTPIQRPSSTTAAAGCGSPPPTTTGSLAESSAASLDHHEGGASGSRHTAAAAAASSPPSASSTPSSLWSQFLLTLRDGSSVPFHYLPVHRQTALLHAVQQDPSVAATWLALAQLLQTGETVNVHQRRYSGTQCCVQAVVLDPKSAEAWFALGLRLGDRKSISIPLLLPHHAGGGNDGATAATPSQTAGTPTPTQQAPLLLVDRLYCYQQAVEQDPSNKTYWSHLAIHLKLDDTVVIHGRRMTEIECFVKSLEMDASPAVEWYTLSRLLAGNQKRKQQTQRRSNQPEKDNGGDNEDAEDPLHPSRVWIHQTLYSAKDCLVEVLRRDFSATMAWFDLAEALGEEEEENAAAMLSPTGGIAGGGPMLVSVPPPPAAEVEINGKQYNRLLCCVKAAERDPTLSLAWYHLGRCLKAAEQQQQQQTSSPPPHSPSAATGGGVFVVVDDRRLNRQQCFAEAVKRDASHAAAWAELAETLATHHQRVTLGPRGTVTSTECLVEAVTLDPQNVGYWWRLAVVLRRKDEHEAQKKRPYMATMAKQTSATSERRQAPQGPSMRRLTATAAQSHHTARTVEEEGEEETHRCRRLHSVEVRHIVYHEMECIEEVLSRDPAHAQALARQRELRGEEAHCPNHFSGIA